MPDHLVLQSLFNRAVEAMERGELSLATEYCRQMLDEHRNDLNAIHLLAKIAIGSNRFDVAMGHARKLLKAQPKDAEFRALLGRCLSEAGRYAEALTQFDRALKLDPASLPALAGKAMVYERQGKYDRAEKLLAPFLEKPDPPPDLVSNGIRVRVQLGDLDGAIDLGRRAMDDRVGDDGGARDALFALANAYERRGDYDEAFAAARRANAINAVTFDRATCTRRVDKLISFFTKQRLAGIPRPSEPSDVPVFIAALPRSGTTLVERIIHAHPDAYGAGEIPALQAIIDDLPTRIGSTLAYPDCIDDFDSDDLDALSRVYLDEVTEFAPRARRISDKELSNYLRIGLISILFPNARVIHCRREPVDNCFSCYMGRLIPAQVPFASDLEDLAVYHGQHERLMRFWKETLDLPILEVDYEAVVEDQEGMTRRIIEFCGLPWDDACLSFHKAKRHERTLSYDQVNKPIYKTSVKRADRYGALLDPLRDALAKHSS